MALSSLSLVGCGLKMDVMIRNPLQVGVVDQPNTITHRNGWQSTMQRLDPEAVCFDVTFSTSEVHQPPNAMLSSQSLLMNSDGTWYEDATVTQEYQPTVTSRQGTEAVQREVGSSNECTRRNNRTNQCMRWEERPIYRTFYEPATYYDATGGGSVCFPNQGRVTTVSPRVVFGINRVNFRWGLQDMAAPPQEETSGGEDS
jgi:hypothetical protein